VIVEDINFAPAEILASFVPVLERGELLIPQRAERLSAKNGFQMIATVTSSPSGLSAGAYRSADSIKVTTRNSGIYSST